MLFLKELVTASFPEWGSRVMMSPDVAYRNVWAEATSVPSRAAHRNHRGMRPMISPARRPAERPRTLSQPGPAHHAGERNGEVANCPSAAGSYRRSVTCGPDGCP